MKTLLLSSIGLVLACAVAPVAAQSCGATVSRNTSLTRDLNCVGRPWALRIDTPGVVLDLKGFTIRTSTVGIWVDGVDDVLITGPGLVEGIACRVGFTFASAGVRATDADRLSVSGVSFAQLGRAVYLEGVSAARVLDNTISATDVGVQVFDAPARGRVARDNEISGNTMVGDINCGSVGAYLDGDNTQGNLVYANRFDGVYGGVLVNSSNNRIVSNTHVGLGLPPGQLGFIGAGVQVAAGFDNWIVGNVVENASTGVHISSFRYGRWTGALTLDAAGNQVIANRIKVSHYGILVGDPGGQVVGVAYKNRIGDNHIRGARVGVQFEANAYDNDARGNDYRGVVVPVLDYGMGNQWA